MSVNSISSAQVLVQDLGDYLLACNHDHVEPLIARPQGGWAKITAVSQLPADPPGGTGNTGRYRYRVDTEDPTYGPQVLADQSGTSVVSVATYVEIAVRA